MAAFCFLLKKGDNMLEVLSTYILSLFPEGFKPMDMIKGLVYIIAVSVIIAVVTRLIHKKASQYNHALSSGMALMFMYMLLIQLRRLFPELIDPVLSKLPLIELNAEAGTIGLYHFTAKEFLHGCTEYLYLFILCFCLIGLDDLIPDAKNAASWIVLQFVILSLSFVIYNFVIKCLNHFIPEMMDSFAPMILVSILLFMIFLGLLKVLLTLMLTAVNPLLAAVSAFFSGNKVGLALGKSVMCSIMLFAVSVFMTHQNFSVFRLEDLTLLVCFAPMFVMVILWFGIGHLL